MLRNKNIGFYEPTIRVLRKMDEVLNRKGILQYQDRMLKIIKFLIKLERNSINCVSNFSANNQGIKMQEDFNQGKLKFFFGFCFKRTSLI